MASRSSEVNFTKNYTLLYLYCSGIARIFLPMAHCRPTGSSLLTSSDATREFSQWPCHLGRHNQKSTARHVPLLHFSLLPFSSFCFPFPPFLPIAISSRPLNRCGLPQLCPGHNSSHFQIEKIRLLSITEMMISSRFMTKVKQNKSSSE